MVLLDTLNGINREDKLKYVIIFAIILYFFTTFTNANISTIIGVFVALTVLLYLSEESATDISSFNKDMEFKLKSLYDDDKIPSFFASDANMIELFSNISDYKDYNYSVYEKLIERTDDFLSIKADVEKGTMLADYDFETAHDIYRNCMNYFRSFRLTLPPELYENHDVAEKRYQLLMKINMDKILEKVKNRPYDVFKKSTYYYDTTRPSDPLGEDNQTTFGAY